MESGATSKTGQKDMSHGLSNKVWMTAGWLHKDANRDPEWSEAGKET